ncbi:MAG TPA: cell envelope integrity EipB family protein [Stellaceae bacterium]|nr:cell envelope integrity EipB family protein [Stellaceae bacterium]
MNYRVRHTLGWAALGFVLAASPAGAVDISPHRALYSLTLDSTKTASGVAGASGAMYYEWGEACDGWTVDQRFRLRLVYSEEGTVEVNSTLLTWESKDGLRYSFNEKRLRNGDVEDDIHGEAHLDGKGKGGVAQFEKPAASTLALAPGVLFPTAHTLVLIAHAQAGDTFLARKVFDGAAVENAGQITAVIGPQLQPDPNPVKPLDNPLLQRPSWRISLAFFSAGSDKNDADTPDYQLTMRLLDNGVSQDMSLDYGDYVLKAKLDDIEALPKPNC